MKRVLLSFFILLFLAGCGLGNPTAAPTPTVQVTPSFPTITTGPDLTAEATVQPPDPTATPIPPPVNTRYQLNVQFNFGLRNLSVDQVIVYTNNTSQVLHDLVLMVEPNNNSGVFSLSQFTWADGQAVRDFSLDANLLHIQLPQPLPASQSIQLHLVYALNLPAIPPPADDQRPVPFGYTDRQQSGEPAAEKRHSGGFRYSSPILNGTLTHFVILVQLQRFSGSRLRSLPVRRSMRIPEKKSRE